MRATEENETIVSMTDVEDIVRDLVEQIPPGHVTTYGTIAAVARTLIGKGSARQVGRILADSGEKLPWWRVVNARGECAPHLSERQSKILKAEGIELTPGDRPRVVTPSPWWEPPLP